MFHKQPIHHQKLLGKSTQGFGLPMALFVITVLALIIASMASMQNNNALGSALQVNGYRAFYASESGIEGALNVLLPPDGSPGRACTTVPFFEHSFSTSGLRDCDVSVSCSEITVGSDTLYTLTATGNCGQEYDAARRTLEVRAL